MYPLYPPITRTDADERKNDGNTGNGGHDWTTHGNTTETRGTAHSNHTTTARAHTKAAKR
jgi:hypothetical protein